MSQNDEFIRELLRRRDVADRELAAARAKHKERTAAINLLLEAAGWVNGAHADRPPATSSAVKAPSPNTTRGFIHKALREAGRPMRMAEIVEKVGQMGAGAADDTIRTVLQKMLRAKQVTRPNRGTYELRDDPPPPSNEVLEMVSNAEEEAKSP